MQSKFPLKSIRKYCLRCCLDSSPEVTLCPLGETEPKCPLWSLRFGKGVKGILSLKAIRAKCMECSDRSYDEIRDCKFSDCELFFYRFGKNPKLKGKRGKGRSSEHMAKIRPKKAISTKSMLNHVRFYESK